MLASSARHKGGGAEETSRQGSRLSPEKTSLEAPTSQRQKSVPF